jgi:ABC-type transport system involved in multi-copper enzyme maturation permease subunit
MSPIHDQTYRRYEGTRAPLGRAWTVILGTGLRAVTQRKFLLIGLILAWIPFIVRAVQIWAVQNFQGLERAIPVDAQMFRQFIEQQGIFVFFVTIYVGAGLIANDLRANALQIYLSKPLLRMEYIGGKLAILASYIALVTLIPALLLVLVQILFSGKFEFIHDNAFVIPAVILACAIRIVVPAFTMLALSSLSKNSRYVGVLFTGAIFFTDAMYAVLGIITGSTRASWVSITANLNQVTDVIFRQPPRYETPVVVSVLVLVGLVVVAVSVLERRVRGVEVVS